MEARGIDASAGKLTSSVEGDIEKEDNVLVVRRIRVRYTLQASDEHLETIERVHEMHHKYCPVYRTLYKSIDVTTSYEVI